MLYDYSSVEREVAAHEVLSESAKTSEATGKQYVRQALDHFVLSQDDRNYHFLIHEPLGANLDFFLDITGRSLTIDYVQELTYQILQALEFIHGAGVIHAGSTLPLSHPILWFTPVPRHPGKEHSSADRRPNSPQRLRGS